MNSSRPFVPNFLKKLDRSLLLNNPSVWSARSHLVAYFGVLIALAAALLCLLLFMDVRQESAMGILTGFAIVISITGLVFWLIFLLRFNVFKRFGNWKTGDGLRTFLLFFFNMLIIVAVPFVPSVMESFMANRQFTDAELIKDANEMNLNIAKLEYEKLPHNWNADTVIVIRQTFTIAENSKDTIWETVEPENSYHPNKSYVSNRDIESRIHSADSLQKINDSVYYFYEVPEYRFVRGYYIEDRGGLKLLTSKDIYYSVIKDYRMPDKPALEKRMQEFKDKYFVKGRYDYYGYSDVTIEAPDQNGSYKIPDKYKVGNINNTMSVIAQKKYRWEDDWTTYLHVMYYISLITSLLVFIFRHSTVKTFFISVLAAVLISIITGLLIAVGHLGEQGIFVLLILYYILFAILGISARNAKTRSLVRGVGLNYFLFFLPVMPLLCLTFYYEIYRYKGLYEVDYYLDKSYNYLYAEIAGIVLLLVLIEPLFKRLYRAWYAAPEE